MSEFAADYAALENAREQVASTAATLERERAELNQSLHSLLDGDWTGPAADQFRTAFADWSDGARTVLDGLHATSVLIEETRQTFQTQDESVSAGMARLHSRLG